MIDERRLMGSVPGEVPDKVWINEDGTLDIEWMGAMLTIHPSGEISFISAETEDYADVSCNGSYVANAMKARLIILGSRGTLGK